MANVQSILDTIRANASTEYQTRVPSAVQTTIENVGAPILSYQALQNEFLNALIGRIALTVVQHKTFNNPLALLKKGNVPLGSDIQEILTNMAQDQGFDGSGSKLLTRSVPDVKALYHRINRRSQYPVTISSEQLQTAFTSYDALEKLLSDAVTSMYSGDNYDEYVLTKNLFASAINKNKVKKCSVSHVKDADSAKNFVKAVKKVSALMKYPTTAFNVYYENKPSTDTGLPVTTWTPIEDQLLIIRSDVLAELDVEVLAQAFNLNKVEFLARTLEVDNFGSASNCLAMLIDKSWVQVYDNLYKTTDFYNGQGMYWNYWLNHWQTYSYSLFANAVAFTCDDETISLTATTATISTKGGTSTLAPTVTPSGATVTYITSDKKVATVSTGGVVTAVENGKCVISCINGDSVANCVVTVTGQ